MLQANGVSAARCNSSRCCSGEIYGECTSRRRDRAKLALGSNHTEAPVSIWDFLRCNCGGGIREGLIGQRCVLI
ncbi:hypothetical protein BRADI_3g17570v3 [Brachypodium distachyon]|uniref:Uncharacterized protein n=1 Tax=Brachypodium distachyon TaxID=15368 RepID=A0A2K2CXU6_BRADI|nr:hypothetical protein BRADI_3g17570v3 [Brachypodium distachyon]